MASALSDLPIELQEIIISHFDYDERMLSSCSLVCKSWLAVVKYHRFREVSLHDGNLTRFLELSDSTFESLRLRAHRVTLSIHYGAQHLVEPTLKALSGSLALTSLHLLYPDRFIEWPSLISSTFSTITELRVSTAPTTSTYSPSVFLKSLPRLDTFWLEGTSVDASGAVALPSHLRTLCLTVPDTDLVLSMFVRGGYVPPLFAVHLDAVDGTHSLCVLLNAVRDSLEHFSFYCIHDNWSEHYLSLFLLFVLTSTKTLTSVTIRNCDP